MARAPTIRAFLFGTLLLMAALCLGHRPEEISADLRLQLLAARLEAVVGDRRSQEPRLGFFRYQECSLVGRSVGLEARCPASTSESDGRVAKAIDATRGSALADGSEISYVRALFALSGQRVEAQDSALVKLEELTAKKPAVAQFWADLAGAYLIRGQRETSPEDYWLAAKAAKRATELEPGLTAAWHNLALAYERLLLRRRAVGAWRRALMTDDRSSGWAEEAEAHLRTLMLAPNLAEIRGGFSAQVLAADASELPRIFAERPQLVREVARDRILRGWAIAVDGGSELEADQLAEKYQRIARLSAAAGEHFPAAVAMDLRSPRRRELATAVLGLFEVQGELNNKEEGPCERCSQLETQLRELESPLALEALRFQASRAYYQLDYAEAEKIGKRLLTELRGSGFRNLEGRASWLLGTALIDQGRVGLARAAYQSAYQAFTSVGEEANAAGVIGQIASIDWETGNPSQSLAERMRAISAGLDHLSERIAILYMNGAIELTDREPLLALALLEEGWDSLTRGTNPADRLDAFQCRGRLRQRLGDLKGAAEDLAESRRILPAIKDQATRPRFELTCLTLESEIAVAARPDQAAQVADEALAICLKSGYSVKVPELLELRARAELKQGLLENARATTRAALDRIENMATSAGKIEDRVRLFDRAEEMMEMAIQIELQRNRPMAALDQVERFRSRFLLERMDGLPLPAEALPATLETAENLIEFYPLEDFVAIWLVGPEGIRFIQAPVPRTRLEAEIAELLSATKSPREFQQRSAVLYDKLIRPLGLSAGNRLFISAGGILAKVPFAGLFARESGRYLVEDHVLVSVPSGSVRARVRAADHRKARREKLGVAAWKSLIVGDPILATSDLGQLENARLEAEEVAKVWRRPKLLLEEQATAAAFLKEAPGRQVIHFAGHTITFRDKPFDSVLLFAADAEHPHGTLDALEIFDQNLAATRLVVLASCGSGTGYASPAEGLLGLSHPFLAAGASNVVTTLWDLDDKPSTAEFMRAFHRVLQEKADPAIALQTVQLEFLKCGSTARCAPRLWAAFQVVGAGASMEGGFR